MEMVKLIVEVAGTIVLVAAVGLGLALLGWHLLWRGWDDEE